MRSSVRGAGPAVRQAGMSIVEVLVVITVVLILIGLLIGALHNAKNRTIQATCAENLHNIYQAIFCYAEEPANHGYIPRATGKGSDWFNVIQPDIVGMEVGEASEPLDQVKIFHCPANPLLSLAYCINAFGEGNHGPTPLYNIHNAGIILLTESRADPAPPQPLMGYSDLLDASHLPDGGAPRVAQDPHPGGVNVVYADGHTGAVKARYMTTALFVPPVP